MYKHMDAEITWMLENKVPPAELDCLPTFFAACTKFQKKARLICDSTNLQLFVAKEVDYHFQSFQVMEAREEAEEEFL